MHTPRADTLSVGHLTRLVNMRASKQEEPGTCFAIMLYVSSLMEGVQSSGAIRVAFSGFT